MKRLICVALFALSTGCKAGPAETNGGLSKKQMAARFYYDLGPETIDVSSYPAAQKKNYRMFVEKCGSCHTAARPINVPMVERADWERFVRRMRKHVKRRRHEIVIDPRDAESILDFLSYDSRIRKVQGRAGFEALSVRLKREFAEVQAKREALGTR